MPEARTDRKTGTRVLAASILLCLFILACILASFALTESRHERFMRDNTAVLRDLDTAGEWQPVLFPDGGALRFDSIFCRKHLVLDANSGGPVTLRVLDMAGNTVLDSFTVSPGEEASLQSLETGADYRLEIRADTDFARVTLCWNQI